MTQIPENAPFPVETWSADMHVAIEQICEISSLTLTTHRKASDKAEDAALRWGLAERRDDERRALHRFLHSARLIIEAIESTRVLMHTDGVPEETLHRSMHNCVDAIDANLPLIEQAFLTVRQRALDLLRWTQRLGHIEGSELPGQYRASYARLIAYAPMFKPRLETMQQELLAMSQDADVQSEVQLLLSALSRYNSVAESARGFVKSVVEPPLELIFQDTDSFQKDWQPFAAADQSRLATEFNDCCQLLLYNPAEFNRRVQNIRPQLAEGMDASLYVLPIGETRVIFTVDEDPLFEQMMITLLRVVNISDLGNACDAVARALYSELSGD